MLLFGDDDSVTGICCDDAALLRIFEETIEKLVDFFDILVTQFLCLCVDQHLDIITVDLRERKKA